MDTRIDFSIIGSVLLVLFPANFFSMYGPDASDALNFTGRLLGSAYIGFVVIAWQVRKASDPDVGKTVLPGFFPSYAIGFVAYIIAQVGGVVNALGWSSVVIMLLFALGFDCFQFFKK